ncbi:MAG TPA: glycosyltransferase family 87 protein [Pirellulaceae bacterium]|nr:glycosyltransferase family 87 protein [Pirellulaceae bacterium]HMO94182.1 glycosyltransferase family 87 protein [Pirellulaceae bacterium]HMP71197.1 glycosyltransferase family 87 protein [Pirellulaceae bacterium]
MATGIVKRLRSDSFWRSPYVAFGVWVFWLLAVAAIGQRIHSKYQTPGPFDDERQGFCDFHNGIYFPALAFSRGVSPYGQTYGEQYPVARPIPFFAPFVMVLHLPYAWLPLHTAELLHFGLLLLQMLALGWLVARFAKMPQTAAAVGAVALFIIVTRAGYSTLFTGYFTFLIAIGTIITLQFSHRPLLAGPAMLLACLKPTYAIPLVILLAARRQWRTLIVGVSLVAAANLIAVGWLLQYNSIDQLIADVRLAQDMHLEDPNEMPVNTWTRVDIMGIVAKWLQWNPGEAFYLLAMIPLIIPSILATRHLAVNRANASAVDLSGLIAGLTILVTIYHHYYDALLIVPAVVALWWKSEPTLCNLSNFARRTMAILITMVLMNYLSAQFVMQRFDVTGISHQIVTSLNAILLAIALGIAIREAFLKKTCVAC